MYVNLKYHQVELQVLNRKNIDVRQDKISKERFRGRPGINLKYIKPPSKLLVSSLCYWLIKKKIIIL